MVFRDSLDTKKAQGRDKAGRADVVLAKLEPDINAPWNLSH